MCVKEPLGILCESTSQARQQMPPDLVVPRKFPQGVFHFGCMVGNVVLWVLRFKRRILALNNRHPFWSASQLIERIKKDMMEALSNRPSGAVVKVCILSFLLLHKIYFTRSHTGQAKGGFKKF